MLPRGVQRPLPTKTKYCVSKGMVIDSLLALLVLLMAKAVKDVNELPGNINMTLKKYMLYPGLESCI